VAGDIVIVMTSTHPFRLRILRSGSSGNAIFLETAGTRLIIDVGLPAEVAARELESIPGAAPITATLLTHEHDDHAKGAGALSRLVGAPVLANAGTLAAAGDLLNGASTERLTTGVPFRVGSVQVEAFQVPHDATEPVGFVVSGDGVSVLIATDLGGVTDEVISRARDADVLILEANYDLRLLSVSPYPWFLKNRILSPPAISLMMPRPARWLRRLRTGCERSSSSISATSITLLRWPATRCSGRSNARG